ncbi:histone acetyltransferase HPA2 [Streptococcus pneumoniae]|nr:histone acetyltransferase HPA2 [Streptococcus pneumoniae]
MKVNIADLHPTQLYLSEKKLQDIQMLYQSAETIQVDPISILAFGDYLLITDGHHRAYQALLAGRDTISAEWDRDGGDELYHLYAQACEERKIYSVFDLKNHILPLWIGMVSFFGLKSRRRENGFQLGILHYLRIISPL